MIVGRVEKPSVHARLLHGAVHTHASGLVDGLWPEISAIGGGILDEELLEFGADGGLFLLRLVK